eukprot:1143558-Pelagomonas_calceolata.AAC.3
MDSKVAVEAQCQMLERSQQRQHTAPFSLKLSCPCRQIQLCNPFKGSSFPYSLGSQLFQGEI